MNRYKKEFQNNVKNFESKFGDKSKHTMINRFDNDEIVAVVNSIKDSSLLSGYTNKFLGGEENQKFENEFAQFHNCKYGISVNSGTTAPFVAQKAAGVSKNDKILVPSVTFTATTSQVLACNAKPVFTDVDPHSFCMKYDPSQKTKYAIPVHLLGHPCNYEMIQEMQDSGIFVIEDCAQAMGARNDGKVVGSMGNCGIFSFQETKHITTLGEGGMIVTNDEGFAEKCRQIRNHGEYYKNADVIGYNFRMTEAQAAFGRVQLKKLPKILSKFRSNIDFICKNLPEFLIPPKIPDTIEHSFLILSCKFEKRRISLNRKEFLAELTKKRQNVVDSESDIKGLNFRPGKIISSGYDTVQYNIPLYRKYTPKKRCVNAEQFVSESIFMDIHRWRTRSEIENELQTLNKF